MYSILDSIFGSNFNRFLLPTWTYWIPKKHCFSCRKMLIFEKSPFEVNIDFWSHCGTNLAPFWLPKSNKIHPKIDSKKHPKNDRFLDRCFAQVGSVLGPSWVALRSQLGFQNGAHLGNNSIQKSIIFWMPLGINFWVDVGGFGMPKWGQIGTNRGSNIDFSENMKKRIWS